MNRTVSLRARIAAAAAAGLVLAASAHGQTAQTYSLSPEEKARVLESGTEARAAQAQLGTGRSPGLADIHGEVAAFVGTGGSRGVFGTAAVPLGENAGAVVSFESSRFGDRRHR